MDELYRDQILEHYKRPHNFGHVEHPDLEFEDTNPFCGDEQHVTIRLGEDGRLRGQGLRDLHRGDLAFDRRAGR
jgi:nitrogen fixation NifU-like protein